MRFSAWASGVGWWKVGGGALVIVLGAGVVAHTFLSRATEVAPAVHTPIVEVKSVAELSSDTEPLSVVGTVTSRSEATVRTEKSGQITHVYRALGDRVGAGTIVAEFENASERAALLQSQGAVDAAQANLDKVQKGTRSEQLAILQSAVEGARSGAMNALLSAYTTVDTAIHGTADKMFTNPDGTSPRLIFFQPNSQLTTDIQNARVAIGALLDRQKSRSTELSSSDDLIAEITTTDSEMRGVRNFLDMIVRALNDGVPNDRASSSDIATYLASASAARTSINVTLSSLAGAKQALVTAQKNQELGVSGAQSEDIAAAQAALKQAQGARALAQASLEKALIRAPISGTINSLSLKTGDYVSASTPVLTVANNGALEILAYITENDSREIAVGQAVTLEGGASGVITRVAAALDSVTKKIEVRIGVSDPQRTLINGQSILVSITRTAKRSATAGSRLTIPISAIKIEADSVFVFTVDADSKLVSHTVAIGALLGDKVEILSGLTRDMKIVIDARGLRAGQLVEVK